MTVPWCDDCGKFWTPTSMTADGACPRCGRSLATAVRPTVAEDDPDAPGGPVAASPPGEDGPEEHRTPWHFKLLVAAVVLYLAWRGVQIVGWILN